MNKKIKTLTIITSILLFLSLLGTGIGKYENYQITNKTKLSDNNKQEENPVINNNQEELDILEKDIPSIPTNEEGKTIYCYKIGERYAYFLNAKPKEEAEFVGKYTCKKECEYFLSSLEDEDYKQIVSNQEYLLIRDMIPFEDGQKHYDEDDILVDGFEYYFIQNFKNNEKIKFGYELPISGHKNLEIVMKDNEPYELVFDSWFNVKVEVLAQINSDNKDSYIKKHSLDTHQYIRLSDKIDISKYTTIDKSKYDFNEYTDVTCNGWIDEDEGDTEEDIQRKLEELGPENCPDSFDSTKEYGGFSAKIEGNILKYNLRDKTPDKEINFMEKYGEKPVSFKAYFSVESGNILYVRTEKNNLYKIYMDYEKDKIVTKLFEKNIKSFFVGEDSKLASGEGQRILLIIEDLDGRYYYGDEDNFKNKKIITPSNYDFDFYIPLDHDTELYLSASNKSKKKYLQYNKKDIIVSKMYELSVGEDFSTIMLVVDSNNKVYTLNSYRSYLEIVYHPELTVKSYVDGNLETNLGIFDTYGISPIIDGDKFFESDIEDDEEYDEEY